MAIPGSPLDPRASGCNLLIREGALLVRSADDIHDALTTLPLNRPAQQKSRPEPEATQKSDCPNTRLPSGILDLLSPVPISEDELIRKIDAPPTQVMAMLAELDMTGQIERQPGGLVSKAVA